MGLHLTQSSETSEDPAHKKQGFLGNFGKLIKNSIKDYDAGKKVSFKSKLSFQDGFRVEGEPRKDAFSVFQEIPHQC